MGGYLGGHKSGTEVDGLDYSRGHFGALIWVVVGCGSGSGKRMRGLTCQEAVGPSDFSRREP